MTIVINTLLSPEAPTGVGSILASDLINRVSLLLQDTTNTRWTRAELLDWLNDAQRQIALMQPTATSTMKSIQLSAGAKQSLPDDGWQLLDVICNMGADGATPGPTINVVSRKLLDAQDPNWYNATPTDMAQNYLFNIQNNNTFYVYPPSTGHNYIEITYSRIPNNLTSEDQTIDMASIHQNLIVDYMAYRAASKDAEFAPMMDIAKMYFESFNAGLQAKDTSEMQNSVNLKLQPSSSTPRGES